MYKEQRKMLCLRFFSGNVEHDQFKKNMMKLDVLQEEHERKQGKYTPTAMSRMPNLAHEEIYAWLLHDLQHPNKTFSKTTQAELDYYNPELGMTMSDKIYSHNQAIKNFIKAGDWKVANARREYLKAKNFWLGANGIFWLCEKNGIEIEELIQIADDNKIDVSPEFVDAVAQALTRRAQVAEIMEPHLL